jgi:undecaprenyl-diphosphatase
MVLDFLINIDYWFLNQINSVWTHPALDVFFVWITDLHKTTYFKIVVVPLVLFLFIRKYKREGVTLFLILLLCLGSNDFIGGRVKHMFDRTRPMLNESVDVLQRSNAGGFSFYSNHSANMFALATYTSHFIPVIKIPLYSLASLVAYSRVYNGVHYPSDIFAGSLFGYIWGLLFSKLASRLITYLKNRKSAE